MSRSFNAIVATSLILGTASCSTGHDAIPTPTSINRGVEASLSPDGTAIIRVPNSQGVMAKAAIARCAAGSVSFELSGVSVVLEQSSLRDGAQEAGVSLENMCNGNNVNPTAIPDVARLAGNSVLSNLLVISGREPAAT